MLFSPTMTIPKTTASFRPKERIPRPIPFFGISTNNLPSDPPLKHPGNKRLRAKESKERSEAVPHSVLEAELGVKRNPNLYLITTQLPTQLSQKPRWNPRDPAHMQAVKQALHIVTSQDNVVCRCEEQKTVLEFCKACIEQEKTGSMYLCGCPGTGKTLTIGRVQKFLLQWSKEAGLPAPDSLAINCTSLTSTTEIFSKILEKIGPGKKTSNIDPPLMHLQNIFSKKGSANSSKTMLLLIVDELDYLVTKDCAVLHDLFVLTTLPFSRCILIGIANAIDLADRFLPKLQSLNYRIVLCG